MRKHTQLSGEAHAAGFKTLLVLLALATQASFAGQETSGVRGRRSGDIRANKRQRENAAADAEAEAVAVAHAIATRQEVCD
jgi:hypothetical protein